MHLYADDIAIVVSSTCKRDLEWQFNPKQKTLLALSMGKIKAMFFGTQHVVRNTDDIE